MECFIFLFKTDSLRVASKHIIVLYSNCELMVSICSIFRFLISSKMFIYSNYTLLLNRGCVINSSVSAKVLKDLSFNGATITIFLSALLLYFYIFINSQKQTITRNYSKKCFSFFEAEIKAIRA